MPEAILYYEQAYHLYGNKVLTAGKNLSTIYLHGPEGSLRTLIKLSTT